MPPTLQAEDGVSAAVSIQQAAVPDSGIAYEIGFAPAFAVETIRLRFVQTTSGTTVQAVTP